MTFLFLLIILPDEGQHFAADAELTGFPIGHDADAHCIATKFCKMVDGRAQGGAVVAVQAHLAANGKPGVLAKPNSAIGHALCAGDPANPIVEPDAVVADDDRGMLAELFEPAKHLLVEERPVRVQLVDAHFLVGQRFNDLEEIRPDERLASCQRYGGHAALRNLTHDGQQGLVRELAQLAVGGVHEAVLAAVIALAGNCPMCPGDEAVLVVEVPLTLANGFALPARLDEPRVQACGEFFP